ncbi:MAG: aromatic amino acid ammonia-lyase, partial [bacterium]|nr:aromatic amino acid ammonia-lyase [bacterium]
MQYSSLKTITLRQIPFQELYLQLRENFNSNDVPTIVYRFLQKIRENSNCWLSLEDFIFCTRGDQNGYYPKVEIDRNLIDDPNSNLYQTRNELEKYLKQNKRIYGVTTGFGSARRYPLPSDQSGWLSANILYSHATGVGKPLPVEIVRGIMLLRLKTFSQGFSAVSIQVLQKLEEMLNSGIIPYVPEKGSVGSSGDLAPLAHLFLVLIGKGKAWIVRRPTDLSSCNAFPSTNAKYALVDNNDDCRILHLNPKTFGLQQNQLEEYLSDHPLALLRGEEAWKAVGLEPLREQDLTMKDGLAMTNGATVAASLLAHAVYDALLLYDAANQAGALTLSAVSGHTRAFEPIAQVVRPHIGQMVTSFQMLNLLQGNELVNRIGYEEDAQDDYSIRAIPQVHGAVWDTIQSVKEKVEIEMNSATDNPLFFSSILRNGMKDFVFQDTRFEHEFSSTLGTTHCSAANFHGEPIAIAADCLKIAISELASISERRIQLLLDSNHNRGLPANLTLLGNGLHSGFMIFQYTAASLVSDNKILCHPASVDSIPTSSNAEDHVSMATNAARHCCSVIQNTSNVIAIELICALQACDLRTKMLGVWLTQKYNEEQKNCGLKEFFQNLFGVQFEHRAKVYL